MSAISILGMKAHRLPSDGFLGRLGAGGSRGRGVVLGAAFIQTETLLNCAHY